MQASDPLDPRAVLGAVKAQPGNAGARGKPSATAGLDRPCARRDRRSASSQTLLDILDVPQRGRTAGTFRRLAKLMTELGWTAVRVRDLTRGGYKEQVRGYVRDGCRSATIGSSLLTGS